MATIAIPGEEAFGGSADRSFFGHPRASPISPSPRLGALFLLRNDRAGRALHGPAAAAARPYRTCRRDGGLSLSARSRVRANVAQALASQTFGFYTGLVYFTPLLGGWIADRLLGAKRTVVIGAMLMSAGHFAMAFDQSFLIALLLLIVGSGCLKGNIAAQVGHLYRARRRVAADRAFTISDGDQRRRDARPARVRTAGADYGWHIGFGCAGVLMLLATVTYLAGQRYLPDQRPRRRDRRRARR